MITVIPNTAKPTDGAHVLQLLRRTGLAGITATSWCQVTADAGDGLFQLPTEALGKCCQVCRDALVKAGMGVARETERGG
jgi:hypothetical protein